MISFFQDCLGTRKTTDRVAQALVNEERIRSQSKTLPPFSISPNSRLQQVPHHQPHKTSRNFIYRVIDSLINRFTTRIEQRTVYTTTAQALTHLLSGDWETDSTGTNETHHGGVDAIYESLMALQKRLGVKIGVPDTEKTPLLSRHHAPVHTARHNAHGKSDENFGIALDPLVAKKNRDTDTAASTSRKNPNAYQTAALETWLTQVITHQIQALNPFEQLALHSKTEALLHASHAPLTSRQRHFLETIYRITQPLVERDERIWRVGIKGTLEFFRQGHAKDPEHRGIRDMLAWLCKHAAQASLGMLTQAKNALPPEIHQYSVQLQETLNGLSDIEDCLACPAPTELSASSFEVPFQMLGAQKTSPFDKKSSEDLMKTLLNRMQAPLNYTQLVLSDTASKLGNLEYRTLQSPSSETAVVVALMWPDPWNSIPPRALDTMQLSKDNLDAVLQMLPAAITHIQQDKLEEKIQFWDALASDLHATVVSLQTHLRPTFFQQYTQQTLTHMETVLQQRRNILIHAVKCARLR